jgi:hypothetical protein
MLDIPVRGEVHTSKQLPKGAIKYYENYDTLTVQYIYRENARRVW